ncbi:hypothetical protein KW798_03800 [Candidatus Parcubacteria bacterium]|nr:hypothetical protein [Candidatus Parcubacteria bacterium]
MPATILDPVFRELLDISQKNYTVFTRDKAAFTQICGDTASYLKEHIFPLEKSDSEREALVAVFWDLVFKAYWNSENVHGLIRRDTLKWGTYCVLFTASKRIDTWDIEGHKACSSITSAAEFMLDPKNFPKRKIPKPRPHLHLVPRGGT